MKNAFLAAALTLGAAANGFADPGGGCAPHRAVGVAMGFITHDIPVDPDPAARRHVLASATGTGVDASVDVAIPVNEEWSVTTQAGAGKMGVSVQRDALGNYGNWPIDDDLDVQRLQFGLQHRRPGSILCGYSSLSAGVYRFGYRGESLVVPGFAGVMGLEVPLNDTRALFFEADLSVALSKAQSPLTPALLVTNVRPAFGIRFRF